MTVQIDAVSGNRPATSVVPKVGGVSSAAICLLALAGCSLVMNHRVDPRTDRPAPQVFGETVQTLPGTPIANAAALAGIWHFSAVEQQARMEHGVEPFLYYALYLEFASDGSYELVYQAYWGSRNLEDPRAHAVDVRESGSFSLSGDILLLVPATTDFTRKKSGTLDRQTIANENRGYAAALDGAYLNLAGLCAQYQVEPKCSLRRSLWYSLRQGQVEWPLPALRR